MGELSLIVSFECDVSDKLKTALENYLHPRSAWLSLTDGFFVENRVYYYGRMVLIVERGFFDVISQYLAYLGVIGLFYCFFIGPFNQGFFFGSLLMLGVAVSYLSAKVRFYLLRWRINKVVDKSLKISWLSKEQVINRFIHGVPKDGAD